MVDEFVALCELYHVIQHHHPAELGVLEDHDMLVFGLAVVENGVRPEAELKGRVERFIDPAGHPTGSWLGELPDVCGPGDLGR